MIVSASSSPRSSPRLRIDNASSWTREWSKGGPPPEPRAGYLWKKSPSSSVRLRKYQWRYVRVENGGVYWWNTAAMADDVGTLGCKGSICFKTNTCEVGLSEDTDARFFLRPLGGKWQAGETFTKRKDGEVRTFTFDTTKSEHRAREWAATIEEHIEYGRWQSEQQDGDGLQEDPGEGSEGQPIDDIGELDTEKTPSKTSISQSKLGTADDGADGRTSPRIPGLKKIEERPPSSTLSDTGGSDEDAKRAARPKASVQKKGPRALLNGVRNGEVSKLVDDLDASKESPGRPESPSMDDQQDKSANAVRRAYPDLDRSHTSERGIHQATEVSPDPESTSAKKKGAAALLKGLRSGEVTKIVDDMDASKGQSGNAASKGYPDWAKPGTTERGQAQRQLRTAGNTALASVSISNAGSAKGRQRSTTPPRLPERKSFRTSEMEDVNGTLKYDYPFTNPFIDPKDSQRSTTPGSAWRGVEIDDSNTTLKFFDGDDPFPWGRTKVPVYVDACTRCNTPFQQDALVCRACGRQRDYRKRDASPRNPMKAPRTGPLVPAYRARLREIAPEVHGPPLRSRARSVDISNRLRSEDGTGMTSAGVAFGRSRKYNLAPGVRTRAWPRMLVPGTVAYERNLTMGAKPAEPVVAPSNYDYLRKLWPLGRDFDSRRTRKILFSRFDINLNGLIGPLEVRTAVIRMMRIPGMTDYGPAVSLAFQSMQSVMPLDGDIEGECLSLRCFRIFLMFLCRYIELWVHFCAMNVAWTRRATFEEWLAALPNFKGLELETYDEIMADPDAAWESIPKSSPEGIRFHEFCMFVGNHGPEQDKWEVQIEPEDLLQLCCETSYLDGAKFRSHVPSFEDIRAKFPLQRNKESIEKRATLFLNFDFNNKCGVINTFEADRALGNLVNVPGVHSLLLPTRYAFQFTEKHMGIKNIAKTGVSWDGFYGLFFFLHRFVELWIRFIAFDTVRDYRLTVAEFTSMVLQLELCGIVSDHVMSLIKTDPMAAFREIDVDNSGYIRFKEFANYCLDNGPEIPDLSGDPMPPSITKYMKMCAAGAFEKKKPVDEKKEDKVEAKKRKGPTPRFRHPTNPKPKVEEEEAQAQTKRKKGPTPRFRHPEGYEASKSASPRGKSPDTSAPKPARSASPAPRPAKPAAPPKPAKVSAENDDDQGDADGKAESDDNAVDEDQGGQAAEAAEAPGNVNVEQKPAEDPPKQAADDPGSAKSEQKAAEDAPKQAADDPGNAKAEQTAAEAPKQDATQAPPVEIAPEAAVDLGSVPADTADAPSASEAAAPAPESAKVVDDAGSLPANSGTEEKVPAAADLATQDATSTTLASAAKAGDASLDVATSDGFEVGHKVIIDPGTSFEERNSITGFGSLLLESPLQFDHAAGATVRKAAGESGSVPANGVAPDVATAETAKAFPALPQTMEERVAAQKAAMAERKAAMEAKIAEMKAKSAAALKAKMPGPPGEASAPANQTTEERMAALKAKLSAPPKAAMAPPSKAPAPEAGADSGTAPADDGIAAATPANEAPTDAGNEAADAGTSNEAPAVSDAPTQAAAESGEVPENDGATSAAAPPSVPETAPAAAAQPQTAQEKLAAAKAAMEERKAAMEAKIAAMKAKSAAALTAKMPGAPPAKAGESSAPANQSIEERMAAVKAKLAAPSKAAMAPPSKAPAPEVAAGSESAPADASIAEAQPVPDSVAGPPAAETVQERLARMKKESEERAAASKARIAAPLSPAPAAGTAPEATPAAADPATEAAAESVNTPAEAVNAEGGATAVPTEAQPVPDSVAGPPAAETVQERLARMKKESEERAAASKARIAAPLSPAPAAGTAPEATPAAADPATEAAAESVNTPADAVNAEGAATAVPTEAAAESESGVANASAAAPPEPAKATSEQPQTAQDKAAAAKAAMEERKAAMEEKIAAMKAKSAATLQAKTPGGAPAAAGGQSIEERMAEIKAKQAAMAAGKQPSLASPPAAPAAAGGQSIQERMAEIKAKQAALAAGKQPSLASPPAAPAAAGGQSIQERMAEIKAKQAALAAGKQASLAPPATGPSPETFSNLPTAASISDVATAPVESKDDQDDKDAY